MPSLYQAGQVGVLVGIDSDFKLVVYVYCLQCHFHLTRSFDAYKQWPIFDHHLGVYFQSCVFCKVPITSKQSGIPGQDDLIPSGYPKVL
jgi:hypothetical protein